MTEGEGSDRPELLAGGQGASHDDVVGSRMMGTDGYDTSQKGEVDIMIRWLV